MGGEGQLGDQNWGGETGEGETETDKEPAPKLSQAPARWRPWRCVLRLPAPDKHPDVLSGGLDSRADEHQAASEEDGPSSTESVVEVWRKW